MITEPSEFMQQLQAIQDSTSVTYTTLPSDEPRFIIDANSRTITIPPEFQFLGVKNDHNAETIYFEIDRYFDDEDLSQHTCVVQFSNKNNSNDGGIYPVTAMDTTSVDGKIIFGWEIKSDATSLVGDIYFSVRFYSINSTDYVFTYNFNTLTAKSVILDTLDVDNPEIFENYPSELDAWLDRMNELEAGTSGKVEEIEAKGQEVLTEINTVKDSIPEDYSTLSSEVDGLKGDLDNIDNYLGSYGNIAKPTEQVLNSVWSSATGTYDSDGWSRISVDVQENTFYTCGYISADFSWFVDANGNSLGRITTNSFITPTGCKKINISEHATTPFVVVNKKLDLIPTIEDFPYGKLYFELESKIDEIEKKTDEVVVIKNIANPSNVYANSYWSGANTKASANDYYCIKIEVEPNKHYTINGINNAFSFYGDANENSLGKIAENRYIYTPNNCKYLYITHYKASEFICINALYEGSLKYSEMPYGEPINIVIDKLSLTNNFKSLNVPYYKTTTIYVSASGSDTDGNGTSENPYATIYKANSVIEDANEHNRYIVKVADGNYTDLQTRYSGISKIDGQNYLGVICKSYVSYVGNVEHPENCVIEWDGSTGLESKILEGNLIYDDLVRKCPFHIVHTYETHVQGFRIIGKNLRYAMHIESEGFGKDTKFTIKNMIFEWNGCPDCNDYKNPAAIGIGSSGWEVGEFDNIKVIFGDEVTSKWSFQTHDNFNQSGNPVAVGCKYTVKNVDFGGGGIQLRTLRSQMSDNKYTCSFENCYGISNIINIKAEEATKVNWAYELRFTEIDS